MNESEPSRIRVMIVEDNAFLRSGWQAALDDVPDMEVVAAYESVEAAAAGGRLGRTDVLLLDIGLPGKSGVVGAREFSQARRKLAIIMVTVHDDDEHVFDALAAGAVGYLLKRVEPDEIVEAIRVAHDGGSPMTPNVARRVIEAFRRRAPPPRERASDSVELTPKEREVLEHLARGESYATVARSLYLSLDGVRYHIRHIYEKLHVHSRSEAVAKGLRRSLIRPPW